MNTPARSGAALVLWAAAATVGCQPALDEAEIEQFGQIEQAIVGGQSASPEEYPWMAQIRWVDSASVDPFWKIHYCGASLIAPNWLMTAAHCVSKVLYDSNNQPIGIEETDPNDLIVTLGEFDTLDTPAAGEQELGVDEIILHPDYQPAFEGTVAIQKYHDIALVRLDGNVTLGPNARVIRLASGNDTPDVDTSVSGWGSTEPLTLGYSPILKELSATVVDPAEPTDPEGGCNARLLVERTVGNNYMRAVDDRTEICTYNFEPPPDDYQSVCYGDSGSPWTTNVSGCAEQIGVHFYGDTACVSYDVAQRVSAYLPWIREQGVPYIGDRVYEAEDMVQSTGGPHDSTGGTEPDGWNIWTNGYIAFNHQFSGGQQDMVVRASAQLGNGSPQMRVTVNGNQVYQTFVSNVAWTDYPFTFTAPTGSAEVRVQFTNDYYAPPVDRNLFVDKVKVIDKRRTCDTTGALPVQVQVTTSWNTGYCAILRITNPAAVPTTDWAIVVNTGNSSVYDSWNPDDAYFGTGVHTIDPTTAWDRVINPGEVDTNTGFCANRPAGSNTLPVIVSATATY